MNNVIWYYYSYVGPIEKLVKKQKRVNRQITMFDLIAISVIYFILEEFCKRNKKIKKLNTEIDKLKREKGA